jgi:hemerythrin-like domain-containing protein
VARAPFDELSGDPSSLASIVGPCSFALVLRRAVWRVRGLQQSERNRHVEEASAHDRKAEPMKATTLLERHHRNLQQLCEAVERGSTSIRESLLPQLATDLVAHMAVEDQLFYPIIGEVLGEEAWAIEGRLRHGQATESLAQALVARLDGSEFDRAIAELRAVIELHAEEEEEGLFARMERALDAGTSRELARTMMSLYRSKVEAGYSP